MRIEVFKQADKNLWLCVCWGRDKLGTATLRPSSGGRCNLCFFELVPPSSFPLAEQLVFLLEEQRARCTHANRGTGSAVIGNR